MRPNWWSAVFKGKVIYYSVVIIQTHKRRIEDIVEVAQVNVPKANPNAEKGRKQNQAKDNNGRGCNEKPGQPHLSGVQRVTGKPLEKRRRCLCCGSHTTLLKMQ